MRSLISHEQTVPRLRFSLPLEPARLLRARQRIRDYLHGLRVEARAVDDIVLALQEAMTNAVRHSGSASGLELCLEVDGTDLLASVRDQGRGFDVAAFDPNQVPDLEAPGGRGLYLIARLVDELTFDRADGLQVRMTKCDVLPSPSAPCEDCADYRETRHREMLDEIGEGVFLLDWEYRFRFVNAAGERLWGRSREQYEGRTVTDVYPRAPHSIYQAVREAMELGLPAQLEYLSPTLGRWLEVRVYPSTSGVIVYSRDIHERRLNELRSDKLLETLRQRQEDLDHAQAVGQIGSWRLDLCDATLIWSDEAYRISGIPPGAPLSYEIFWQLVHPDDRAFVDERWQAALRGEPYDIEHRIVVEGQVKWVREKAFLERNDNGDVVSGFGIVQDISERKRAEEDLLHKEVQMRHLIRHAAAAIYEIDFRGPAFTMVNDVMCAYTGYSHAELLAMDPFRLIDEESAARFRERVRRTLAGQQTDPEVEYRFITKQGEERYAVLNVSPVHEDGGPIGAFVVAHDVTERRHMEEQLRQSEQRFRTVLEDSLDAAYRRDLATDRYDYVGPKISAITGLSSEEFAQLSLPEALERVHPDDQAAVRSAAACAKQTGSFNVEYRFLHKDGHFVWLADRATVRGDERGEPRYLSGAVRDISERQSAEQELRESESFHRQTLESIPGMVFTARPDGDCDYQSKQWEEYTGVPTAEHLGEGWLALLHPEDRPRVRSAWRAAVTRRAPYDLKYRVRRHDGAYEWFKATARAIRGPEGEVVRWFGVSMNIEELMQAEAAVRDSEEQQCRLARSLDVERRRLETVLRDLPVGVWISDADGRIVSTNDAARRIWRGDVPLPHGPDEYIRYAAWQAESGRELRPQDYPLSQALASRSTVGPVDLRIRRFDGSEGRVLVSCTPILADDGRLLGAVSVNVDITERTTVEAALREREELLRTVLDNSRDGINMLDLASGRYIFMNDAQVALTGFAREEIEEISAEEGYERVHPDDRRISVEQQRRVAAGEDLAEPVEYRWRVKGGEYHWFSDRRKLVRDAEGRPVALVGVSRDVTQQKEAEERLRASEAEKTRLHEIERRRAHRLEALRRALDAALSSLDPKEASRRMLNYLVAEHGFEYANVWLAANGVLELLAAVGYPDLEAYRARTSPMPLSGPLDVVKVFACGEPLIVSDAAAVSPAVSDLYQDLGLQLGSYVILPLTAHGVTVGTLNFGWRLPHAVDPDDLDFFLSLSGELGVVLENARLFEAQQRIATTLQENLIHPLPTIKGLDLASLSLPAHRPELVGGDFHDVFPVADDRVVVLIGDVMGKGVRAAGLTETVRSSVRALSLLSSSPAEILGQVNRLLLIEDYEQFASALLIHLDLASGRASMASAGHPPPVHLGGSQVELLEPPYGPLLGLFATTYEARTFTLESEASLILYTDGLIEARREGEQFGERRLLATLSQAEDCRAEASVARIREAVLAYAGSLQDDLEILALRRMWQSGCRRDADETPPHGPTRAGTAQHESSPESWTVQHK